MKTNISRRFPKAAAILCGLCATLPAAAGERWNASHHEPAPRAVPDGFAQSGMASFYRARPAHGGMTVAHKTLPKGTRIRVTNLKNGESGCAYVTDRGPFIRGRIVDLSIPFAHTIGLKEKQGVVPVKISLCL